MPSSNRGFSGRGNGTITVIEEPVLRSYRRKAKVVFYVTWVITAVLAATIAASRWHPIIALLAGIICGYVLGAAAGVIVAAWPVLRAIWWWTPETLITGSLVYGWIELADHTTLPIRLAATAAIAGVPLWHQRSCQHGAECDCLVFVSRTGRPHDRQNVLRRFRTVVKAARLTAEDWAPRELRHSFVSL